MIKPHSAFFAFVIVTFMQPSFGQQSRVFVPSEAREHIGEEATVCGQVASTRYDPESPDQPTFLNLERPYPDQPFTAVVPGNIRDEFPAPPEELYAGKRVCVSGLIDDFNGLPRIILEGASRIVVSDPE